MLALVIGLRVRKRRAHVQLQLQLRDLSVAVPLRRGNGSLSSALTLFRSRAMRWTFSQRSMIGRAISP
jgi:hypothetical protein